MFDRDLVRGAPEDILEARALLTLVGGRVAWNDPEQGFAIPEPEEGEE